MQILVIEEQHFLVFLAPETDLETLTRASSSARPLLATCGKHFDTLEESFLFFCSFSIGIEHESLEFKKEILTTKRTELKL